MLPAISAVLFITPLHPQISSTPIPNISAPTPEIGVPVFQGHSFKEFKDVGQIWTILQDKRGIMYFGNSGGDILEYDGATWRRITTNMSVVRSLATDDSGKVWVGGNGSFGYLAPDETGATHYVPMVDKIDLKDRSFTDVWQIAITPQGNYFRSYGSFSAGTAKRSMPGMRTGRLSFRHSPG